MKKTLKTLLFLATLACIVAVFTVCAFASDTPFDYTGVAHVTEYVDKPGYNDIYYSKTEGFLWWQTTTYGNWVQVATGSSSAKKDGNSDGAYNTLSDLHYGSGYKAYYNGENKTLVIIGTSSSSVLTASYGHTTDATSGVFPNWCTQNADKVETIEFRNMAGFNNLGYIISPLKNVKTIKIDTVASKMQGSKSDTAAFASLSSLTTVGWGSWATDGTWTASEYYEEGVVDLRGFTTLTPGATTSVIADQVLYFGSAIQSATSVKKVILPATLTTADTTTVSVAKVSDGTATYPLYDGTGNVAKGKAAYQIKNTSTGAIAYTTGWQMPTGWEAVKTVANDIAPYNGQFANMIPHGFASGATSLETVVVPSSVTLHRIYASAFNNCKALRTIILEGAVADDFVVDAGAFGSGTGNVSNVIIEVKTNKEARIINNALTAAGYTDRTKVKAVCPNIDSPITVDGFQVKINTDYNGLRGLFSFDEDSKTAYQALGLEFSEYGVIVCTRTVAEKYGSNDAILNSGDPKVKKVAVEKADGTGENRYVDYENRQFCIAVTGISKDNSMDDVCFIGYSIWTDEDGTETALFTNYVAQDGEKYVNLYEVTMGLFKNGLLNTETVENAGGNADAIIWTPLEKGAVTIAKSNFATPGTPKNTSTSVTYKLNVSATYNSDGSFTYLNQPLYATTGANGANYSYNPSNYETTASTNVLWSLYTWGDEYVAVYRRDPAAASDEVAFLPTLTYASAKAIHPFGEGYGALATNKVSGNVTIYSPVLSTENAKKVTTLVIDYGVNSTEKRTGRNGSFALGNMKYTTTLVYPNDFTPNSASQSLLRSNTAMKNAIWANKPAETEAQKYHMGDVDTSVSGRLTSLVDLRGMGKLHAEALFMESGYENIVFAGYGADSHTQTLCSLSSLSRVWIDGKGATKAPAEKTIDLSKDTVVTKLGRQSFAIKTEGYTIKLSDKVSTVSTTSADSSYLGAFAITFGAKFVEVNVEAPNPDFAASFYDYYLSFIETDYRTNANYVKVNGKTYLEIAEDVCFVGEDKLEIFPELPEQVNRDYSYKVTVHQGDESAMLPVYNHTMFNGPGNRSIGGDYNRRYSTFAFCGEQVRVDIKVGRDFKFYSVIPSAKNFKSSFDKTTGTISVYLDEPDYFAIRLDDDDNTMISIFAENPEYPHVTNLVNGKGGAIVFESGTWYKPTHGDGITQTTSEHTGTLYINTPDTVLYIQPGAVVYGRIKLSSAAKGSSIVGYGAIIDCFADNRIMDIRQGGTEGGGQYTATYKSQMVSNGASNVLYDGPTIMDARCFHIVTSGSYVHVRNYKAMSTMMTSDGITDGTKAGGIFEHCWLYVGDNALVVSGAQNAYYNDIAIGTTCAAVFPQGSVRDVLVENTYVFRSNDGIISHRYNPNNNALACIMTFRNFDCVDTVNYPQFFWAHKMGTSTEKVITFENVTLPWSSGTTNPHPASYANYGTRNRLIRIEQVDGTTCGNYVFNFINTYMDGVLLDSRDKAVIQATLTEGTTATYNFKKANNGYVPPVKSKIDVSYTATGKVYIGALQVYFDQDVIIEGSTFYLPADEILAKLRTTKTPTTVTKNGIKYVAHTALKSSGAAQAVSVSGGNLTITPVAPATTANIIEQNAGLITREYESTCYNIDLVQKDGIMYAYPTSSGYNGGIAYNITEEVKMYGAGTYKLTLKAMCVINDGGAYTPLRLAFNYDTASTLYESYAKKEATLTANWVEYTLEVTVTENMVKNGVGYTIYAAGYNNVPVQYYAVKDMTVTKIS